MDAGDHTPGRYGVALAFGISKSWPVAILAEVVTPCVAGSLYFIGGQDTDIGAQRRRT